MSVVVYVPSRCHVASIAIFAHFRAVFNHFGRFFGRFRCSFTLFFFCECTVVQFGGIFWTYF